MHETIMMSGGGAEPNEGKKMHLDKETLAKLNEAKKLVGQKVRSRAYEAPKTVSEVFIADKDDCGLVICVDFTDGTYSDLADIY